MSVTEAADKPLSGDSARVQSVYGWGRWPRHASAVHKPSSPDAAARLVRSLEGSIAMGNARSYGDAALGAASTISTLGLDRFVSFDPATGILTAEAGVILGDVIDAFLPRGWFPPVVPGTRFITLGGALAANVHGKNHHGAGGFSTSVEAFTLATPHDGVVRVTRQTEPALFSATVGGMGLTGVILDVSFQLASVETGWIIQKTQPTGSLSETLQVLRDHASATYSVAWIDCVTGGARRGRSLVYLGEHASLQALTSGEYGEQRERARFPGSRATVLTAPVDAPGFALNKFSVLLFNELYYRKGSTKAGKPFLTGWQPYFFPLDGVAAWNRIYGRRGFAQHQCVIPFETAEPALDEMLQLVTARGDASFLAVLKTLGEGEGELNFPKPGFTLALDFPMRSDLPAFLHRLDDIVVRAGGRLYLAKDAHQSRATFEAGYGSADRIRALRRELGADRALRSLQSERLGL